MGGVGFMGVNQPPKHGRINVGMRSLLDACKTLVKGVGSVRTVSGEVVGANGMWALEKIGWLIPQGDEQPLLPIECLRRRGVVKFGASAISQAATNLISNGVRMMSISGGDTGNHPSSKFTNKTLNTSPLPPPSLVPTTYTPNSHKAMTVPITYGGGHDLITPTMSRPIGYFSTSSFQMMADVSPVLTQNPSPPISVPPPYKEEMEYWYPSMEWSEDCAWPAFAEIEAVFPRPACLRY
jgi:hypothetical protein